MFPFYKKEIWEIIPDLKIHGQPAPYGVLNERAVRATAWIMFLVGIITMLSTYFTKDYTLLSFVIVIFFINFIILVTWGPKYSPISMLGKWSVRKQRPEWVWAIQKRFAWALGLVMSFSVIVIVFGFWINGMLPLSLCSICLLFMWLESSIWVCVGCKIYGFLEKHNIIFHEHKPACPGWACSINYKKPSN